MAAEQEEAVALPPSLTFDWLVPDAGDPAASGSARGRAHDIIANCDKLLLKTLAPSLPWEMIDGCTAISYMPLACFTWPCLAIGGHNAAAVENLIFDDRLLAPSAMARVWNRLSEQGFQVTAGKPLASLMLDLNHHALNNPHEDFFLRPLDLTHVQPAGTAANTKLPAASPISWIRKLELEMLASPPANGIRSLLPIAILEYLVGPRTVTTIGFGSDSRYNRQSQFHKVLSKLSAQLDGKHPDLKNLNTADSTYQDTLLDAVGAFLSDPAAPYHLIRLDFAKSDTACSTRAATLSLLTQWQYEPLNRNQLTQASFDQYVQAFPGLSNIVYPAPPLEVHVHTTRLRMELMPSTQDLGKAAMTSLGNKLLVYQDLITNPDPDKPMPEAMDTAAKRTQLVLDAIARPMTTNTSMAAAHHTGTPAATSIVISPEWRQWVNSSAVQRIEQYIEAAIDGDEYIAGITYISRCRQCILMQCLHSRKNIPGSSILSRTHEMGPHYPDAISYAMATQPNLVTNKLEVIKGLEDFKASDALVTLIKKCEFEKLSPHVINYMLAKKKKKTHATIANVPHRTTWGNHTANSQAMPTLDAIFHFLGFDNEVFSNLMKRAQDILLELENMDPDDANDIKEDITTAVRFALAELGKSYKIVLTTSSCSAKFPHDGKRLVAADSGFYTQLHDILKDIEQVEDTDARFRTKAKKRRTMEADISSAASGEPTLPPPSHTHSDVTTHCLSLAHLPDSACDTTRPTCDTCHHSLPSGGKSSATLLCDKRLCPPGYAAFSHTAAPLCLHIWNIPQTRYASHAPRPSGRKSSATLL